MSKELPIAAAARRCLDGENSEADFALLLDFAEDIAESNAGEEWDQKNYAPPTSPKVAGELVLAWLSKRGAEDVWPSLSMDAPIPAKIIPRQEERLVQGVTGTLHPKQLESFISKIFMSIDSQKQSNYGSRLFDYTSESHNLDLRWLYVLQLEDECWYVGITTRLAHRKQQHINGQSPVVGDNRGACWTGVHRLISEIFVDDLGMCSLEAAKEVENGMTLKLMEAFGWRRVRGGDYSRCSESATWNDLKKTKPEVAIKLKSQSREFCPSNYRSKATRCFEPSCDVLYVD